MGSKGSFLQVREIQIKVPGKYGVMQRGPDTRNTLNEGFYRTTKPKKIDKIGTCTFTVPSARF